MLMWFADGRMREFEAFSCDDVDSVHNDFREYPGREPSVASARHC